MNNDIQIATNLPFIYDIQIATVSPFINENEDLIEATPFTICIDEAPVYEVIVLRQNNNPFNYRSRRIMMILLIIFIIITIIYYIILFNN